MSRTIVIDLFNGQGYSDSTAFEVNAWNDGIEQAQEIVNAQFTDDDERIVEFTLMITLCGLNGLLMRLIGA